MNPNEPAFPTTTPEGHYAPGLTKREYFAAMLLSASPEWGLADGPRIAQVVDAVIEALSLRESPSSPAPAPSTAPTAPVQVWPLPPNLRVPRLAADVEATDERSTGQDSTGAYYEDFYNGLPVRRDKQGYFVMEEGKEYVTYLNPPGASIEHRIVPRPGSGSTQENNS